VRAGRALTVGAMVLLVACSSAATESEQSVTSPVTDLPADPGLVVTRDVAVDDVTTADVFAPSGADGRPVVVLFHGTEGVRARMEPLAVDLAESGAVVVVPSWPVLTEMPALDTTDDVYFASTAAAVCSVRFARATAVEHGGDPSDLTVLGHSGGAPLAARVALVEEPPWPGIDCYPGVSSHVDRLVATGCDFHNEYQYSMWIPEVHHPYDVFELVIANRELEVELFHGISDLTVESWHPSEFDQHLDAAGVRSGLLYVEGSHGTLIDPSTPAGRFVADQVAALVHGATSVFDEPVDAATLTFDDTACQSAGPASVPVDRLLRVTTVNESSVPVWFSLVGFEPDLTDDEVAAVVAAGPRSFYDPPDGVDVGVFALVAPGNEDELNVVFVRDAHRWISYCMPEAESGHPLAAMMIPGAELVIEF
jgi:acetyl esterase/lipase